MTPATCRISSNPRRSCARSWRRPRRGAVDELPLRLRGRVSPVGGPGRASAIFPPEFLPDAEGRHAVVAMVTALVARRVGLGIEVDDDLLSTQLRQAHLLAVLVRQLEVRRGLTNLDHHHGPFAQEVLREYGPDCHESSAVPLASSACRKSMAARTTRSCRRLSSVSASSRRASGTGCAYSTLPTNSDRKSVV